MPARRPRQGSVPLLEWIAAALGLAVLISLLAILGSEALRGAGDESPRLSVRLTAVEAIPGGHVARIAVANASRRTAASVQIEGTLGEEVATATIDYVPGRSEAHAGLIFRGDPRDAELRVTGFELP